MTLKRPTTQRDYLAQLRVAYRAEEMSGGGTMSPGRSMLGAGESWGQVDVGGGQKLWWGRFEVYRSAPSQSVGEDGCWRFPLRSSLARMADAESDTDRVAAYYLFLLCNSRFHARSAFAKLVGPLADAKSHVVADAWLSDCLRRWWRWYVELPSGDRRTVGPSDLGEVGAG